MDNFPKHPYFSQGSQDIKDMLDAVGADQPEDLFSSIPGHLILAEPPDIQSFDSEQEMAAHLEDLSLKNRLPQPQGLFMGGGAYQHYIPAIIRHLLGRTEFYSSYTPYQPEISQGNLQAIFEYQSMICMLTGMEVANASMYDGGTSLLEALLLSYRISKKRKKICMAESVHPQYRQIVETYLRNLDLEIIPVPYDATGGIDLDQLRSLANEEILAVAVQSPNYFGVVENLHAVGDLCVPFGIQKIAVIPEILSLGMLKPPGCIGFDIVCGEAQSFGIPLSFGGPYLGFLAAGKQYLRQMPGRIAGETVDADGKRGYVLTLSTREQHIRRERATSNICTNHALCALSATIYLELLGKEGLMKLAKINFQRAHYLHRLLNDCPSVSFPFSGPFFNEFTVHLSDEQRNGLTENNMMVGPSLVQSYPELSGNYLIAVTEMNTPESIDRIVSLIRSRT